MPESPLDFLQLLLTALLGGFGWTAGSWLAGKALK